MKERRSRYLRENLRGKKASWAILGSIVFFTIEGASIQSWRLIVGGIAFAALVIFLAAYYFAHRRADGEFFAELAPQLGLEYTPRNDYPGMTPLLSAGDRRRYEHAFQGPLYGKLGGPPCMIAHYTFDSAQEVQDVTLYRPHPFTVCIVDGGAPMVRFRGVYMRPRISGLGLEYDWLNRGPKFEKVELESVRFNELYDLRRASDQDPVALRELFSPSLVMSLAENPLRPGFECKAGTLVVFVKGHTESAGGLTLLQDTARSIARRIAEQDQLHFSAAGQMMR